jgi:hypothetical protein
MDPAHIVAEHKIVSALDAGLFDDLPACGQIDCSLQGLAFITWWFRTHYGYDGSRPIELPAD